ncbi:MAG: tetratricopeptide repeat protein [Pirellulaceae bacterium]|jgi:tetratricopeptide (TPR) repeat protein
MSKKRLLLAGGGSLIALLGFGALFAYIVGGGGLDANEKLKFAMTLLDEGRWDLAGHIARELEADVDKEKDANWHYVQGVSKLQSVENNVDTAENRRVLLEASQHLIQAEEIGFPTGYLGQGKYYLGWCEFNTYHWDEAVKQLQDVDRLWPEKRSDALRMQVEAQLRKSPPDSSAAEAILVSWQAIAGMSQAEQDRIKLAQANLAFLRNQPQRCEELLQQVPSNTPSGFQAALWRARWRLAQAAPANRQTPAERVQLLEEAKEITRTLKLAPDTPIDLRRQATYLSGKVLRAQGAYKEALSTFSAARQSSPHSAEAIVSGLEEAEMLVEKGELSEANASLHYLLRNLEDISVFNESWISLAEFRSRLLDIGRRIREAGEFERALDFAELIGLAFPLSDSVRLKAEAYEQWAEVIANSSPGNRAQWQQAYRDQVRGKHQAAAEQYQRLAQLELRSTEYPDILWRSITNYQQSGDLDRANALLIDYLRYEDRTKRPRGFLAMGRNFVNAGEWQKAIEPLERCRIEHPTHPISFEARLLAAKALYELDRLDDAAELLEDNLSGSATSLRPTSDIWRDSLFQLAHTRFRQGEELLLEMQLNPNTAPADDQQERLQASHDRFLDVVNRLGGFVTRYPQDPRHFDAMYLVAKSHRLAAETPQRLMASNALMIETARRKLLQQRRQLLEQALSEFRNLHQTITREQESLTLPEETTALLRNCYFGEADALYELNRWEEAINAYQNVASRFLNKPESLEALLQMSQCYHKLGQDAVAQRVLAQAEQVLTRIPAEYDPQFGHLTRASRTGWSDLLGSLRKWD